MRTTANDPVDAVLAAGLKDLWYPICPSDFVAERPVSLRRLGRKFVLWRETSGTLHALEDHCPHRARRCRWASHSVIVSPVVITACKCA